MFLQMDNIILDITWWKVSIGILMLILPLLLYRRTFPSLPLGNRLILMFLRIAGFILILVFLIEPVVVSFTSQWKEAVLLELIDVSRSMGIKDCGGKSRIESAVNFLRSFNDTLSKMHRVKVDVATFSEDLISQDKTLDDNFEAVGEGTDIVKAIESACKLYSKENLNAIVLVSDGRVTRGLTRSSSGLPVPVFTAGFGDTVQSMDVAISDVICNRVGYIGTEMEVTVYLQINSAIENKIEVRLTDEGKIIDSGTVKSDKNMVEGEIKLSFIPRKEGRKTLAVEIVTPSGEDRLENNRQMFGVEIFKEKIRVLLFDQVADWNMTFLRELVDQSERFTLETVTQIPGKGNVTVPGGSPWGVNGDMKDLQHYDLVIIGDFPTLFSHPSSAKAMEDYVKGGGSVLFIAGESSPLLDLNLNEPLKRVVPLRVESNIGIETGMFRVNKRERGFIHSYIPEIFRGDGFLNLPPLSARIKGFKASAGAEVPLVVDSGGDYPFLAIQRVEEGIVAATTCFPLWYWKLEDGVEGKPYDMFWGGLIQYLSEQFRVPAMDLYTDRSIYRRGDRIKIAVHLKDERFTRGVRGEIYRGKPEGGKLVKTFSFTRERGVEGGFRHQTGSLAPGDYYVVAREIRDRANGVEATTEFSVMPLSVELINQQQDRTFLEKLAESTGGTRIGHKPFSVVNRMLKLKRERVERRSELDVGRSKWLFVSIIVVMALEWIVRKSWGLV